MLEWIILLGKELGLFSSIPVWFRREMIQRVGTTHVDENGLNEEMKEKEYPFIWNQRDVNRNWIAECVYHIIYTTVEVGDEESTLSYFICSSGTQWHYSI